MDQPQVSLQLSIRFNGNLGFIKLFINFLKRWRATFRGMQHPNSQTNFEGGERGWRDFEDLH